MADNTSELASGSLTYQGHTLYTVSADLRGGTADSAVAQATDDWWYLTDHLDEYDVDYWPPHASAVNLDLVGATVTNNLPVETTTFSIDAGHIGYSFLKDFYDRIHVTPNPIYVGYVLAEKVIMVEVWNAYLTPKTLLSLTPANATGADLVGPAGESTTFLANEARTYTLTLGLSGPATIAASFTFEFEGQTPVLNVEGARSTLFPIPPNWKTPILERLEWVTDVLESRDGSEQRIRLRQNPRQSVEFEVTTVGDSTNLLESLLYGWQGRAWGAPLWFHAQRLPASTSAATTSITCPTDGYEFQAGGYAVLYLSEYAYEVVEVSTVSETGLTTASGMVSSWPAGAWIVPVRLARIKDDVTVHHITGEVATCTLRFWSEHTLAIAADESSGYAEYSGLPVLEVKPVRVSNMTTKWERKLSTIDNTVGPSTILDKLPYSKVTRSHDFVALNRTSVKVYRNIAFYAQGRWKEFWAPTFNRDMRLALDVNNGDDFLYIRYMQYHRMVHEQPMRKHIRLELNTGQVYYRAITSSDDVNTPAGTEKLNLDAAFVTGFKAASVMVSFMSIARFDTDVMEFNWRTPAVVSTTAQIKGVIA